MCNPGEMVCVDERTLGMCDDSYNFTTVDCEERCNEEHGIDSYTIGCDAEAADPCQCVTDIVDGMMAECEPGDLYCADDRTVAICEDSYFYTSHDCDERCRETHGPDFYSMGCDAEAEDPCRCEYGIVDGEAPMCDPGDVICFDDETVGVCEEGGWDYTPQDCAERCVETHGEGSASAGCDPLAEDPCLCEET